MIYIGNVKDISNSYDENWMIVRLPDEVLSNAKIVKELSPSKELFKRYRKAFHRGEFNKHWFDTIYAPQFISELAENKNAITILKELVNNSHNKDYFLCCYCEDEELCHRSIIAGILLGLGADIHTKDKYIKYYKLYLNEINQR